MKRGIVVLGSLGLLAGCASQNPTCGSVLAITPTTATADHTAAPPGNQQQFTATSRPVGEPGCDTPLVIPVLLATWTVSDTAHVSLSSAEESPNALATCLGPTTGAATVTATVGSAASATKLTASLTCK